jgi:hypothetical protein
MKKFLLTVFVALAVLSFSAIGSADVIDPYDNISAPPGTFVLVTYFNQIHYPDYYDNNGDDYDFGLDQSMMLLRPVYFAGKIAGKLSYGVNAIIPVAHLSLDSDNVFGAPSVSEFGLGDIAIAPFLYLYENPDSQLYISFWEFIFMPTGDYDMKNAVNIGRDTWWFQHQLAFGWYPSKFGVDFNINFFQFTESDDLKYDESDALELETVVHYGITDKFRVGINAAYWMGVADAEIDGVKIPDSEPMSFKLGLNLAYTLSENFTAGFRWMHDVDSENNLGGDWAYVKLTYVF